MKIFLSVLFLFSMGNGFAQVGNSTLNAKVEKFLKDHKRDMIKCTSIKSHGKGIKQETSLSNYKTLKS